MKKFNSIIFAFAIMAIFIVVGCDHTPDSDEIQQQQQEVILKDAAAQIGMPSLPNHRDKKMYKAVMELRDQEGLVTYMYLENMIPTVVKGHTCCGGKFSFIAQTIGYGIPAATQFTSPQKATWYQSHGYLVMPQADPTGLFSPTSAEGTWIMMPDPTTGKLGPQYIESRISVFTFKFPFD